MMNRSNGQLTSPIFIVGAPRSGTTLLRLMLDAHPNISCGPETSFLVDLKRILGHHWSHLEHYGFEQSYWEDKIAHFFSSFQEEYANKRNKVRWAEKTPMYTPHLPFILQLFPSCQVVHIIRDGRDVTTSALQRWGYRTGLRTIKEWSHYVTTARAVGKGLPQEQYYELRYETLVTEPEPTLRGLFAYLQEPWVDSVLQFQSQEHDIQPAYAVHTTKRRTEGNHQDSIYRSRIGAWRQQLPLSLKLVFRMYAGKLAKELGYD